MGSELINVIKRTVDAWNNHDIETLSNYLSEKVVLVHPSLRQPLRGKGKYMEYDKAFLQSFPDAQIEIVSILDVDNLVAFEFVMRGTHLGAFKGKPASGKRISIPIVEMISFRKGKISEVRRYLDPSAYDEQLS